MQDKLKQFVNDHRDEFDVHQPPGYLWEQVGDRLHKRRNRILWQQLTAAASILLIITFGTFIFLVNRHSNPVQETVVHPIMETEVYFTSIVQMKDAQLEQYCKPHPELCREFEKDLEMLSNEYRQLKADYPTSADKKAILRAMTGNLQMQVQLITRQLEIMESVTQQKKLEVHSI